MNQRLSPLRPDEQYLHLISADFNHMVHRLAKMSAADVANGLRRCTVDFFTFIELQRPPKAIIECPAERSYPKMPLRVFSVGIFPSFL